jgi:heat shock protein HtpX
MVYLKRFFLFALVNILVMATVSVLLSVLGVGNSLTAYGIDYQNLAIYCLIWGMAGSFISLFLSKFMAKTMMGLQVIDESGTNPEARALVHRVHELARAAGLPKMPEVAIYDSPDVNAFATGPSRSNSLVAVSTGLLNRMNQKEVDGVLAHEVAHIANGDMVTMTLIQGVINAFVLFLSRVAAFFVAQLLRSKDDDNRGSSYMLEGILSFVFQIILSILGMMVVAWFSRYREFRADEGSARLSGKEKMIAALQALKRVHDHPESEAPESMRVMQIRSNHSKSFVQLFSTHPSLDDRIAALQNMH